MINSVGQAMSAAVEAAKLRETTQNRAPKQAAPAAEAVAQQAEQAVANPAARLAAQGAPVDLDKIARIKQAIASGNYPVDPDSIAEKMLELDLPGAPR